MLREKVGRTESVMQLPDGSNVADLWTLLQREYAPLSSINIKLLYAVNNEYVDGRHELKDGDEVVFVPPVSGGVRVSAQ